jgi:hypothetical protein
MYEDLGLISSNGEKNEKKTYIIIIPMSELLWDANEKTHRIALGQHYSLTTIHYYHYICTDFMPVTDFLEGQKVFYLCLPPYLPIHRRT